MRLRTDLCVAAVLMATVSGCRARTENQSDSSRTLPPVYPSSPLQNTHWDADAGSILIVSRGAGGDTAGVVLPEATDSTIATFQGLTPPTAGLTFDLFGRGGRLKTSVTASPLAVVTARDGCYSWPLVRLHGGAADWSVGLQSGHAVSVALDSIETRSSTDSAALAVSLAQMAAVLPLASEPTFRGLPFRVRSAYTFHLDSTEVVVADVVRTVNEEANPRVEHLFIVGERPAGTAAKFTADYYSRTAGAEDTVQATDVLAVLQLGADKHATVVVNVEYDDGGKLGFIERDVAGHWAATWTSAYTGC
ncbi:MAG TPA: hypothetical protein VGD02_13960 [Gemmatimonadaceae bacterium]